MSNIVKHEPRLPAMQMDEQELMQVLQSSLYPGAEPASIKMVLGYCKAAGLDPMRKPVHIVPMWDSKARKTRDVTMPGIGLYRTDAARTGEHVGTDEPVFGPMVEYDLSGTKVTVPEWCKVTVYRLKNGLKCAYTATEYWIENYATASKDTTAPNTMWRKRGRGQLAKCTEAQALRKGFPEVGNQPTADEMEGKVMDMGQAEVVPPAAPTYYDSAKFDHNLPKWAETIAQGRKSAADYINFASTRGEPFTEEQKARLLSAKKAPPTTDVQDVQPKDPPATAPNEGAPAVTYADVAAQLHAALTTDALDDAASLIGAVENQEHRRELSAIYDQCASALNGSGE